MFAFDLVAKGGQPEHERTELLKNEITLMMCKREEVQAIASINHYYY